MSTCYTVIKAKCPYCGNLAEYAVSEGFNVLACDIEDTDGCDKYFAVKVSFRIEHQTFELKKTKDYPNTYEEFLAEEKAP